MVSDTRPPKRELQQGKDRVFIINEATETSAVSRKTGNDTLRR
jgi:hypothetical protein